MMILFCYSEKFIFEEIKLNYKIKTLLILYFFCSFANIATKKDIFANEKKLQKKKI